MDINDSELLKLERVIEWAKGAQQSYRNIDQFTKDVKERINGCGFECTVKVFDTNEDGVFAFEIEIDGRLGSSFDPDRQVHEVTNNLLELPGQDKGFIDTKGYLDKLAQREFRRKQSGHQH